MIIYYHSRFKDAYRSLPASIQKKAERRETIFRKNPFDPRLKTHKLQGALENVRSFSIDKKYRVVFSFDNGDVIFLDVGDHDVYR